jgi:DNA-binding CsgD family transcriptional regulator
MASGEKKTLRWCHGGAKGGQSPFSGQPSLASLAYGLFIATNATCLWGGLFPFLPAEFRASKVMSSFYLAVTLSSTASYLLCAAFAIRRRSANKGKESAKPAVVVYLLGWVCVIAAAYVHAQMVVLTIVGGTLLGVGISLFYELWQQVFSSQEADKGDANLLFGTALGSLIYFGLMLLPETVTAFLIPLVFLPLFGLALILCRRQMDVGQPMFQDDPSEHREVYRHAERELRRSALCVGGIGFCAGIMRSLSVMSSDVGMLVNLLSMGSALVAATAMLCWWGRRGLTLSVVHLYQAAFPFLMTSFLALSLLGTAIASWMAGALYALYNLSTILMTIRCAQTSRESGVDPLFIYGAAASISTLLNNVGFIAGSFSESVRVMNVPPMMLTGLVSCYLLSIIYHLGQVGAERRGRAADAIELVGPSQSVTMSGRGRGVSPTPEQPTQTNAPNAGENARAMGSREKASSPDGGFRDRVSKQVEALRRFYGLSTREAQVMELIARGYSVPRMAEQLVVSENTIRTHTKRICKKLDVHKKQELLDLMESFDPVR